MMTLVLPWPPSVNDYWKHVFRGPNAGRVYIAPNGKQYREAIGWLIRADKIAPWPKEALLRVTIAAHMPDRRKRDLDNLGKAVLDSLTHAGVWEDDSQIDDLRYYRVRKPDGSLLIGGMLKVTIEEIISTGR
jgi:crossover junction endodeoxyribonuclease RusA